MDSLDSVYDIAIIGTGLAHSIVAAALARSGRKVIHLDANDFYGGRHASLNFQELLSWAKSHEDSKGASIYSSISYRFPSSHEPKAPSHSLLTNSRQYAIPLSPALIPSTGDLIDALTRSGVSKYSAFRLLDALSVVEGDSDVDPRFRTVPSSKEDIFKDKSLSLIAKRKLMKMLQYALGEYEQSSEWQAYSQFTSLELLQQHFGLDLRVAKAIVYSIAGSSSSNEPALTSFPRLRRYMRSAGRYGASPFLVGHYGGLGELAQGFCRACAVNGGTYILGRSVQTISVTESSLSASRLSLTVEGISSPVYTKAILRSPGNASRTEAALGRSLIKAILIFDSRFQLPEPFSKKSPPKHDLDSIFLSFPPGSVGDQSLKEAVSCFITGSSTMSCPEGESLVHLIAGVDAGLSSFSAEELLRPYVDFLSRSGRSANLESNTQEEALIDIDDSPPLAANLTEIGDILASRASDAFWKSCQYLTQEGHNLPASMWPEDNEVKDDDGDNS